MQVTASHGRLGALFVAVFSTAFALLWAAYDPPRVNVRWREGVTLSTWAALEAGFRLTEPRHEGGTTWSYALADTSAGNIQRLVQDPRVEDTHYIDRRRFELTGEATPAPLVGPRWFVVWSALIGAAFVAVAVRARRLQWMRLGTVLQRVPGASAAPMVAVRNAVQASGVPALLTRGVTELPAEALGLFRMFFAVSLFLALNSRRHELVAGYVPDYGGVDWEWVRWLASRPELVTALENAILALLVLVAVGLFTRPAYLLVAAGLTLWMLVRSLQYNAHLWLVTILTVLCLVPVRWDIAFSLDETLRRWRGRGYGPGLCDKSFGYAVWIPGLVLGTVWASAAYAKMDVSGPEWVLSGAVKYHWVIDAQNAPVNWAEWIAIRHWAAVLMSFAGVLFESVFVFSVLAKPGWWRALLASTGLALMLGFFLFHGLLWWTWLLVYISFAVPWASLYGLLASRVAVRTYLFDSTSPASRRTARFWHGLDWFSRMRFVDAQGRWPPGSAPSELAGPPPWLPRGLKPIHWVLIAAVCLHATIELPGGYGRFTSYSNMYRSTDEFDQVNPLKWVYHVWVRYGSTEAVEVDDDLTVDAVLRLTRNEPVPSYYAAHFRSLDALNRLFRAGPRHLTVTGERRSFNWELGRFNPYEPAVVVGTLDLDSMTLTELGQSAAPSRSAKRDDPLKRLDHLGR